jgi:hypothetical protein
MEEQNSTRAEEARRQARELIDALDPHDVDTVWDIINNLRYKFGLVGQLWSPTEMMVEYEGWGFENQKAVQDLEDRELAARIADEIADSTAWNQLDDAIADMVGSNMEWPIVTMHDDGTFSVGEFI